MAELNLFGNSGADSGSPQMEKGFEFEPLPRSISCTSSFKRSGALFDKPLVFSNLNSIDFTNRSSEPNLLKKFQSPLPKLELQEGSKAEKEASPVKEGEDSLELLKPNNVAEIPDEHIYIKVSKEALATLFNPEGKSDTYDNIQVLGEDNNQLRAGRYALSYEQVEDWLNAGKEKSLDLSNPRGLALQFKLKLLGHPEHRPFVDQFKDTDFASGFCQFLHELKNSSGAISGAQLLRFLPPQLQELIAFHLIHRYSRQLDGRIGPLGLSFYHGRPPSRIGLNRYFSPTGQRIMKSTEENYNRHREKMLNPSEQFPNFSPRSGSDGNSVLDAAKTNVGEKLWAQSDYRNMVNNGRLGCAASVCVVLQEANFEGINSASVGGLVKQLKQSGWKQVPISQASPGDVVYGAKRRGWESGGGNAHVGIIGENGKVYHNQSSSGKWVEDSLATRFSSSRFPYGVWALSAPDQKNSQDSSPLSASMDKVLAGVSKQPNKVQYLENGAVFIRSDFDVDADGSPRATQIDPKYGQLTTSLVNPDGSYVNAETIPYFVLPLDKYKNIAKLGDLAAIRYKDRVAFAVFADVGPARKYGEGSIALAKTLGIPSSPISGGVEETVVDYLIFPGSGDGTSGTVARNNARGANILKELARSS